MFPLGVSSRLPNKGSSSHSRKGPGLGVRRPGSTPVSWLTPVPLALPFLISDLCLLMYNVVKVKITNGRWMGVQITWNPERWVSQEGDDNFEQALKEKPQSAF